MTTTSHCAPSSCWRIVSCLAKSIEMRPYDRGRRGSSSSSEAKRISWRLSRSRTRNRRPKRSRISRRHCCQERPRGRDDEDAVGSPPRDQLGEDEARLDRLAEADAVGEEEADAAHPERAHHRHELVGLDVESPGLDGLRTPRGRGPAPGGTPGGRGASRRAGPPARGAGPSRPARACSNGERRSSSEPRRVPSWQRSR